MSKPTKKLSLRNSIKAYILCHFKVLWFLFGDPHVNLDDDEK